MNKQAKKILRSIKLLSSNDADFEKLLQEMHKLAALTPLSSAANFNPGTTVYRGTNHHVSVPARIEEIWYPPTEYVRSFGRANPPGTPMFYCCSAQNGAFAEIRAGIGQYAVLATWVTVKPMMLHEVGYSNQVLKRASASRSLHTRHADFNKNLTPLARKLREFLALAFTDPTATHYRITAAIAQMFLASDDIVGIMYPGVARSANV